MIFLSKGNQQTTLDTISLLFEKYEYDPARRCRYENGELSPAFNQCLVERVCLTAITVDIAFGEYDEENEFEG